ncbi:hypothetical protein D3C78_557640 [compost metagenome]
MSCWERWRKPHSCEDNSRAGCPVNSAFIPTEAASGEPIFCVFLCRKRFTPLILPPFTIRANPIWSISCLTGWFELTRRGSIYLRISRMPGRSMNHERNGPFICAKGCCSITAASSIHLTSNIRWSVLRGSLRRACTAGHIPASSQWRRRMTRPSEYSWPSVMRPFSPSLRRTAPQLCRRMPVKLPAAALAANQSEQVRFG